MDTVAVLGWVKSHTNIWDRTSIAMHLILDTIVSEQHTGSGPHRTGSYLLTATFLFQLYSLVFTLSDLYFDLDSFAAHGLCLEVENLEVGEKFFQSHLLCVLKLGIALLYDNFKLLYNNIIYFKSYLVGFETDIHNIDSSTHNIML